MLNKEIENLRIIISRLSQKIASIPAGPPGPQGPQGIAGPQGSSGSGTITYGFFYNEGNTLVPLGSGDDLNFGSLKEMVGNPITRKTLSTFQVKSAGTYQISYTIVYIPGGLASSISLAKGQTDNVVVLDATKIVTSATGTNQILTYSFITDLLANDLVSIRNSGDYALNVVKAELTIILLQLAV